MDDLRYLSASEALALFRSRTLSPLELLDSLIEWGQEANSAINAIAEQLYDRARVEATAAADRYVKRPAEVRPLEGLPVAAKEEQPISGHSWTEGSLLFADRVADTTHPVIERVRAAGGIIHMRTTTPEFSCAICTHSRLWGITRNPWNLDYSPGGSSGGSAAVLAAGMTPLATGSDIGGSIRVPAGCTGVVGFKPPYGRVPEMPPFNLDAYCHAGPMARTVADCALLQNVLAGVHPIDHVSLRPTVRIPATLEGVAGLRIALAVNLGDWVVEPEVEANTRAVADALRNAGAIVTEVEVGLSRGEVERAAEIHFSAIFGTLVSEESQAERELLSPYARQLTERAAEPPGTWLEGLMLEAGVNERMAPIFERHDAFICPTAGFPALPAGEDYLERDFIVAGQQADPMFDATMTLPFNILSRHPVLAAPSGWASSGVPTGVQIVGRTYDDVTPFRIGAALELERPWGYRDGQHLPAMATAKPATSPRSA